MSGLLALYQDIILDHNRSPRNFRKLAHTSHEARGFNPLCGDKMTLYLEVEDQCIRDVGFEGSGCAISTASASLMTERLKGMTLEEAGRLFHEVHHYLTQPPDTPPSRASTLGKLEALGGVRQYPARVKCATLAWHTLEAALHNRLEPVTTELEPDADR
jgi:nitrogen fixation NifU-like protein